VSDDDRTVDELKDELRERDLPVSGTKQELRDRLEDADADEGSSEDDGDDAATSGTSGGGDAKGIKPVQVAALAARQLRLLTGRDVEGAAGLERADDGWRVLLEVLEVARVPRSTDVLGLYEVTVDADGDVVGYERLRRFVRGQAGDDQ
jgi:hypothetical protein